MSSQIFVYIEHHGGAADDTALELINSAKKIDPEAKVTAVVSGSGSEVDNVAQEVAATYPEVWKIDNSELSYPNAEIIRGLLLNLLPQDSILLLAHDTFGMDLAPGLSVKLDSSYVADVVDIEDVDGNTLKTVRQEFGGQVHAHVNCDIAQGAVVTIRPGTFPADESKSASGEVVDKSSQAGSVESKRIYWN